jgi:hypothetical protein
MKAPLAIRAWTLFYSFAKALAEPVMGSSDNRPRLFFISAQYTLESVSNKILDALLLIVLFLNR